MEQDDPLFLFIRVVGAGYLGVRSRPWDFKVHFSSRRAASRVQINCDILHDERHKAEEGRTCTLHKDKKNPALLTFFILSLSSFLNPSLLAF